MIPPLAGRFRTCFPGEGTSKLDLRGGEEKMARTVLGYHPSWVLSECGLGVWPKGLTALGDSGPSRPLGSNARLSHSCQRT